MMCFLKAFDKVAKCQKSAASSKIFVSLEALKSFLKKTKGISELRSNHCQLDEKKIRKQF